MAIKLPEPGNGIPEQKTGNDEWTNMKIVRDNFADQRNAASRLVGSAENNLAENKDLVEAFYSNRVGKIIYAEDVGANLNAPTAPAFYTIKKEDAVNWPPLHSVGWLTVTRHPIEGSISSRIRQTAYNTLGHESWTRVSESSNNFHSTSWIPTGSNKAIFLSTTATAANVTVNSDGVLQRSSSSEKYKDILSDLELDDVDYNKAMQVKPIVYRSKAELDPKDWHFLSFSAEEVGELEPALTQWKTHDYNEDGERVELEKKEAEGINLNAICAVLHATNIYQDKKLKELEQRLTALESNNEPIE